MDVEAVEEGQGVGKAISRRMDRPLRQRCVIPGGGEGLPDHLLRIIVFGIPFGQGSLQLMSIEFLFDHAEGPIARLLNYLSTLNFD